MHIASIIKMECIVCISEIEGQQYCCSNNRCKQKYCGECLIQLIQYCHEETLLPVCPSVNCRSTLLLCNFANLPKETIKIYEQCCLNFFLKEQGDGVKKQLQEKEMLKRLQEERQRFITQTYPEAIALIATISFKNKLKQLEKQKQEVVKKQLQLAKRTCMNTVCNGYLSDDLKCLTCQTEFCQRCERRLQNNHQCKQEDLDSINIINNMISCPGCGLKVFKNEGCNNITCSNCGTKFEYTTGEEGGSGSHNAKITVDSNQKRKLSVDYKDKLTVKLMEMLVEIESLEPKSINKDILLTPLKEYYQNKNIDAGRKLAKQLEKYYLNHYKVRDYFQVMIEIEDLLLKNKLTGLTLYPILGRLKRL